MKRIILTALLFLLWVGVIAQTSVKFQVGYAFPTESEKINSTKPFEIGPTGSYAAGMRLEFGFLQTLSDLIDVELNAAYLSGKKIETGRSNAVTSFPTGFTTSWQFSPMVRFKIINSGKFKPYFGIGPVAAFGKIFYEDVGSPETFATYTPYSTFKKEDTYSFDFGLKSVAGLRYGVGKVNAFFELGLISLSVSPDKSEITNYESTINGQTTNHLPDLPMNERIHVYKESIGPVNVLYYSQYGEVYSNNERLRYVSPLSCFTVSAGVIYELSFKKNQSK